MKRAIVLVCPVEVIIDEILEARSGEVPTAMSQANDMGQGNSLQVAYQYGTSIPAIPQQLRAPLVAPHRRNPDI